MAPGASRARRRRRRRLRSSTIDVFEYSPLDSSRRGIRLLTIAPGWWDEMGDTLRCTIQHAFLPAAIAEDNFSESGEDGAGNDSVEEDTMSNTSDEEDAISNNSLEECPLSSQSGEDTLSNNSGEHHMLTENSGTYFNATSPSKQQVEHTSTSDTDEELGYGSRPKEPEYETISYAWGDASQRDFILLDGLLLDVPRSSERALRNMRLHDRPRTVWIDAVCIDQSNTEERSQQVEIMADIYRHGQQNLIYLGDAPESTQAALDSIELLMETEIADAIKDFNTLVDVFYSPEGATRCDFTGLTAKIDVAALAEFYSRPWFSRLWVLQEVALAKHNVCTCGPFNIELEHALVVAAWLILKVVLLPSTPHLPAANMLGHVLDHIDVPHPKYRQRPSKSDILNLLFHARISVCTDPRDKVYAIIGLIKWSEHGGLPKELTPNYSRSVADVLGLAGSWAIRSDAWRVANELLSNVSHRSHKDIHLDGLASWIPRWHRIFDAEEDSILFRSTLEYESISMTDASCEAASWEGPGGLHFEWSVQGIFLAVVKDVYTGISGAWRWRDFSRLYMTPLHDLLVAYEGYRAIDAALWKLLTASTWADRDALNNDHIDILLAWAEENMSQTPPFSEHAEHDRECCGAVRGACYNRVIAKLEGGFPVLAPMITVPSDVMVWISGSDYPTVLRPFGKEFQVIGPAYIHDALNHKAVVAWQKEKKGLQTFVLV